MNFAIAAFILALAACASEYASADEETIARGQRAYQKCYSCHALEPGRNDLSGPTLYRIVGRRIAAETGFEYSTAMKSFAEREPVWTRELLDRFSADPEALVPGTNMTFHGIADEGERKALIAYLERQTSASAASLP